MKKSKLLIPALAIASVGCTVAPVIVSCGSKTAGTVTVAMTDLLGTGISYTSPTTSTWNFGAGATVKYTGVKMYDGAQSLTILTTSAAGIHEITSMKINNTAVTLGTPTLGTYTVAIPGTPAAGSELSIEVVYKTASQTTGVTAIGVI